jgi:hypothetical protein
MFALRNDRITTSASSSLTAGRPLHSNRFDIKGAPPQHEAGVGQLGKELGMILF